jgi:hypothetical protein
MKTALPCSATLPKSSSGFIQQLAPPEQMRPQCTELHSCYLFTAAYLRADTLSLLSISEFTIITSVASSIN